MIADPDRRRLVGLGALFGAFAFLQTVAEPSDGVAAQPVRALWMRQGRDAVEVGALVASVALPWSFKPLFGLLSDAVPIPGGRRRGYLILGGGVAAVALGWAGWMGPAVPALAAATAAVALADVASDALLIEHGRRAGRVGTLQAIQWGSAYAAAVAVGPVAGEWAHRGRERTAMLAASLAAGLVAALALAAAREPGALAEDGPPPRFGAALRAWFAAIRSPGLVRVAAFLALWNFNPFAAHIFQRHVVQTLGLGERFYGWTDSAMAGASVVACLLYPALAARVAFPALVRWSIGLGVASTLIFLGAVGPASALAASAAVGLTYMTATLIQLELAARACPPGAVGGAFATLMAVENLAAAWSAAVGGRIYGAASAAWGEPAAFRFLVLVGAATTAASWLVRPRAKSARRGGDLE